jgi:hypothetical protein
MKTTLTIFALLSVLTCSAAFAQDEDVLRPRGGGRMGRNSSSNSSSSSTPIMLGIEAGINYNMFSQTITGLVPDSRFAVFGSGKGISPLVGAFIDVGLTHNLGLQVKLAYDQKKFGNTKDAIRDCRVTDPIFGTTSVVDAQITGEYTNTITYIDLTPQLRWNITPEFFLLVGPTVHFKTGNASQTFTETISSQGDCFYNIGTPQQSKQLTISSDSVSVNSPRFGAQIDVGYKFILSPSVFLVPKAGFQYMFTRLVDDENGFDDSKALTLGIVPISLTDRLLHSLQFSLGLWFQL